MLGSSCDSRVRIDSRSKLGNQKPYLIDGEAGRSNPLVPYAARVPVPKNVALKRPQDFKLIGTPAKRLDTPAKANGTAVFGIDVRPPGVKIATLAQSPVFGGRVKRVDDAAAKAVKGVQQIVRLDDAVAVVADHMGAAKKGLAALVIEWDAGPHRQAHDRCDRKRARTSDAQVGGGRAEHRRCRQGHGGRRHQGRSHLPSPKQAPAPQRDGRPSSMSR
jgi:hypothetical protein